MGIWASIELYNSLMEIILKDNILIRRVETLLQRTKYGGISVDKLPPDALRMAYIMAATNVAVFEDAKLEAMISTTISRRNDDYYLVRALRPTVEKYKKQERLKRLQRD